MEAFIAMNFRDTSAGVRGGMIEDALGWNPAEPAAPRHLDIAPITSEHDREYRRLIRQADAGTIAPEMRRKIPALLGWFSHYCTEVPGTLHRRMTNDGELACWRNARVARLRIAVSRGAVGRAFGTARIRVLHHQQVGTKGFVDFGSAVPKLWRRSAPAEPSSAAHAVGSWSTRQAVATGYASD